MKEVQSRLIGLDFQGGVDHESKHYLRRLYRLTIETRRGTNLILASNWWSALLAVDNRQSQRLYGHVYCVIDWLYYVKVLAPYASKFRLALGELSINRLKIPTTYKFRVRTKYNKYIKYIK